MNKKHMRRGLLGLTLAIAPFLAQLPAFAQLAQYAPFKDTEGNVYLAPGSANAEVAVTFGSVEKQKDVKADACGVVRLTPSSTIPLSSSFKVDGVTVDPTTLSTDLLPKCVNGTLEQARPNNFKTADGKIYIVGKTAGSYYKLAYNASVIRKVKSNACGIARMGSSASTPLTAATVFTVNGTDYTYGNLPTAVPWRCTGGVTYMPYGGS
jgi:hypothetical protein